MIDASLKELATMVSKNEKVLWFAKPNKKCFILESIFNPLLPFALLWGIIDFGIIGFVASQGNTGSSEMLFMLAFFALHLMPVWIYLGGVLMTAQKYKNTAYVITTRGIYISSGLISKTREMKPFADLSHVNIHRGLFDQILGVGDVVLTCSNNSYNSHHSSGIKGYLICDIADYQKVFNMVKELQTDIYSDTMFPNALRPKINPGYNTQYNKFDSVDFENQ